MALSENESYVADLRSRMKMNKTKEDEKEPVKIRAEIHLHVTTNAKWQSICVTDEM